MSELLNNSSPTLDAGLVNSLGAIPELTYKQSLEALDRYWIQNLMHRYKFNQSKVAIVMGISRGNLRIKLRKHFGNEYFRDGN